MPPPAPMMRAGRPPSAGDCVIAANMLAALDSAFL